MSVDVRIVGLDLMTEVVSTEISVPSEARLEVMRIAGVPETDPELMGSYPLGEHQLRLITDTTHIVIEPRKCSYFLEANEE